MDGLRIGIIMFGPAIIGGAEKRYANFFTAARRTGADMHLLVNRPRFVTLAEMGVVDGGDPNVTVADLPGETPRPAVRPGGASRGGGAVPRQSVLRRFASSVRIHVRYLRIWRMVERWRSKAGITVLHGVFQGVYAMTPYFFNRKAATVVSYNASSLTQLDAPALRWFLSYRAGLQRCDQIDFLSGFVRDNVRKYGVQFDDGAAGVSPCSFIDYVKCVPAPAKEEAVAFCGRLIGYKNPLLFVEAATRIAAEFQNVRFYILGTGPLEDDVAAAIREAGFGQRAELGFRERPEEVLARTSIFVSLQETNNYPSQSLMEAMACGNAVIATDVGETRMLVDDETGILVRRDPEELAAALRILLTDRELRRRLGENARTRVLSEHTVERFASYMDGVYRRAADRRCRALRGRSG